MDCPKCHNPLIVVERNKIEVDYCMACKGIWFDAEELALLNQALQLDKPISDSTDFEPVECSEEKRKCPRCNKVMNKVAPRDCRDATHRVSALTIDRCPQGHGLWFDAGELSGLFQSKSNGGSAVHFLGEVFGKAN